MAKNKKLKKGTKKKVEKKRFSWKVWMTIASVFLGVSAIAGAVVLGVYLTGGFEEKIVAPERISFGHDENTYLEVEENFQLVITTDTPDVTETKVTLSFDTGIPVVKRNGKISNHSIEIPEVVYIGEPFTVRLLRERLTDEQGNEILENGQPIDWIVGGLSTIYTTSEAGSAINTKINIAVDVPVYATETIIVNSNGEETTQVVTNESFTVKTKFIPAKSEYMYSDNERKDLTESQMRVKRSFYEAVNTDKVTAVYDDIHSMHFVAGDTMVSAETGIQINSNTFISASAQLAKEVELIEVTDAESYHQRMLEALVGASFTKTSNKVISIGEASIGNFVVANNRVEMNAEQPLRLYLNQYNYQSSSAYLGVNVYSTSGLILDRLLSSVAISFQKNGNDAAYGDNKVLNIVGGDEEGNYVDIDGMRYYKPNANGSNMRYSYWDIKSNDAHEITMKIVLLVENESKIFQISGQDLVYNVTLSISKHEEQPLAWTDQNDLEIMLDYDAFGNIEPYTLNLNALTSIPEENIFKDYVFFASFGSGDLSAHVESATKVFGEDGYDITRSGVYSTNSGNLALFAIDRSVLNIYEAGTFSLYYGTIKTENGQPIYDNAGLYQMAVMCSGFKRIISEKALYTNSVDITSTIVNTSNFPEQNGEISINQGSELSFSITFIVSKESVAVFKDEFQQSFMTPMIKDIAGNDISSYFTVDDGTFEVDEESGQGELTYSFKVKPAVQIEDVNGIYFGSVALNYNDRDERNITWESPIPTSGENAQIICIYKPQAVSMSLVHAPGQTLDGLKSEIQVNQTLTAEGVFDTSIKVEGMEQPFNSITEFLNFYLGNAEGGNVVILDQKQKYEPLYYQWKFEILEGNANVISVSENSKSFIFKDTDSENANVKLVIKSLDENATLKHDDGQSEIVFDFVINSVGITSISYDKNEKSTYVYQRTENTDEIASATVSKYGAKADINEENPYIILDNLIEFYIGGGIGDLYRYENVQFHLTPQYILAGALSDEYLIDLYGRKVQSDGTLDYGMLTLYSGVEDSSEITFNGDYSASNIRQTLLSTAIYKIRINKDFAIEQTLYFTVSDQADAVNTSLILNLLANVTVSSNNYPTTGETVYAGEYGGVTLINQVTNRNYPTKSGAIGDVLYQGGTYYIVLNNSRYELVASNTPIIGNKGYFSAGVIKFNDFWDTETQDFRIFFQPEGDNIFAINQVILFTVSRDLVVNEGTSKTFYVLTEAISEISNFANVTRKTTTKIPEVSITYDFGGYLEYADGNVQRQSDTQFFFDYNQKVINTKLYVKLEGQTNENALSVIDVNIEIASSEYGDIYQDIAKAFTSKGIILDKETEQKYYLSANIQNLNDVGYLTLDMSDRVWTLSTLQGKAIKASQNDYFNNSLRSIYSVNGQTNAITFASQKPLLYGLGDNTKYINIMFLNNVSDNKDEALAIMHLPIILSNIGYNTVVYDKNVEEGRELETALTNPQKLLEKVTNDIVGDEIYNEVSAGKVTQILTEVAYTDTVEKGGLYALTGTSPTINIYSLNVNNNEVIKEILISKNNDNKYVGNLTLNHLTSNKDNIFIAFEYILNISGNTQTFYYLLKVKPDVQVEETIYAYDGISEYLPSSTTESNSVDLEAIFPNTSLHEGYKRFNVSKNIAIIENVNDLVINVKSDIATLKLTYNGKTIYPIVLNKGTQTIKLNDEIYFGEISSQQQLNVLIVNGEADISYNNEILFSTLTYLNEIVSVQVGDDDPLTSESDWSQVLAVSFSGSLMTYQPISSERMNVTIKHTYPGSENGLAVIGGEQYYSFILNETSANYTVRFTDGQDVQETADYKYEIENSEGTKEYNLTINLIKNEMAGSSLNQTIEYNKLSIQVTKGEEFIANTSYDSATGKFTLKTLDYIDSDKQVIFTIYIEQGYLATMTVNLKANVSVTQEKTEIDGGQTVGFGDLFTLTNTPANVDTYQTEVTGDSDFVSISATGIEVADLIKDKNITVKYIVNFEDGNKFIFSQSYSLKANIKPSSSYSSTTNVVAGETHTISQSNLLTGTLANSTLSINAISSSGVYKEIEGYVISTNYVAESITVELTLTVTLTYNNGKKPEQTFTMSYSFPVIPSVEVTTTYPKPNDDLTLPFEYIEDQSTFANIETFIESNPIFASSARVIVNGYNGSAYSESQDLKNATVVIASKDNAILTVDGEEVKENTAITTGEIKFSRGLLNGDSNITFRITYQQVSKEYNVKIIDNSLTLVLNPATNNSLSGKINEGTAEEKTVSYERIYVDKTSTENLFAEHRMIYAQMTDTMASYADEYYLIFLGSDGYYSSKAIYFSTTDQSKDLYFDLGTSMQERKFVGAFLTTDIEKAGWNVTTGSPIVGSDKKKIIETNIKELTNYAGNLFKASEVESERVYGVTLAHRVQMVYGQYNGKDILVDYDYYKGIITHSFIFSTDLDKIATCDNITPTSFTRNDGSNSACIFTLAYNYMPSLDIAVKEAASTSKNHIQVEVNQEYMSIVSMFGIIHPSNNRAVSPSNFTSAGDGLTFTVIDDKGAGTYGNIDNIITTYRNDLNGGNNFKSYAGNNPNNIYIFTSGIRNSSTNVCDYSMIPFGAKNLGDYVLGKIDYKAGEFTKTFYVVIKVVPDYIVTYGGSVDNAGIEEEGAIVSNLDNPNRIAETTTITQDNATQTVYTDFVLAGAEDAYLSITHKNGTGTKQELSVSKFDITLPEETVIDSLKYNVQININNKLKPNNASDWDWTDRDYQFDREVVDDNNNETQVKALSFTKVIEVVFGNQYYMIEGKDVYGYTYRLYFMLQATKQTPVAKNSIEITENGFFDIGVQYEMLSISHETSSNDEITYHINSIPVVPTAVSSEVPLVVLEGIEAWLFDKDYTTTLINGTTEEAPEYYLVNDGNEGYNANNNTNENPDAMHNVKFASEDSKYLNLPDLKYVSVSAITFYSSTGDKVLVASQVQGENLTVFATNVDGKFNGMNPRSAYGRKALDNEGNPTENDTPGLWQVGRIDNTDVYGNSTSVNLTALITLKYDKNGVLEYYDCPVNVTVKREVTINEVNETKVQRDGKSFAVAEQFTALIGTEKLTDVQYLQDTLEVLVPTNSTVTFEMALTRGETEKKKVSVTLQNNNPFATTKYISLSQYFGFSVHEKDEIKISKCTDSQTEFFYMDYISGYTTFKSEGKLTIKTIEQDVIFVEDATLLSSTHYYGVTKYYVLATKFGSEENNASTFYYRATRNYTVTGIVYQLERNYTDEIGFKIESEYKNEAWTSAEISDWKSAFTLYKGTVEESSIIKGGIEEPDETISSYLSYSLDLNNDSNSTLTMGKATIEGSTIKLDSSFKSDQYIKVVIKMGVSGPDRNIGGTDTTYLILDTLNLSTVVRTVL